MIRVSDPPEHIHNEQNYSINRDPSDDPPGAAVAGGDAGGAAAAGPSEALGQLGAAALPRESWLPQVLSSPHGKWIARVEDHKLRLEDSEVSLSVREQVSFLLLVAFLVVLALRVLVHVIVIVLVIQR